MSSLRKLFLASPRPKLAQVLAAWTQQMRTEVSDKVMLTCERERLRDGIAGGGER